MKSIHQRLLNIGIGLPDILLPNKSVDLEKWAVVACDQFTSEPEYWADVEGIVGDKPSTLHLILPECFLGNDENNVARIHKRMKSYLESDIFDPLTPAVHLIERCFSGKQTQRPARTGILMILDLEQYDYHADSTSIIRPTEGTIVERIPARKQIRRDAPVELPHILVLLDDPQRTVVEPLVNVMKQTEPLYSFQLMKDGGCLSSYRIEDPDSVEKTVTAFEQLAEPSFDKTKSGSDHPFFLAVGDGNHSLAAAKEVWRDIKQNLPADKKGDHPARYALVEIVNLYDDGIIFEPIHRILYNTDIDTFLNFCGGICGGQVDFVKDADQVLARMRNQNSHSIAGFCGAKKAGFFDFNFENAAETIAKIQGIIDSFLETHAGDIDFVHDLETVLSKGQEKNSMALIMPAFLKSSFFSYLTKNGCYPRKSFSLGESQEKRYYMEARRIY